MPLVMALDQAGCRWARPGLAAPVVGLRHNEGDMFRIIDGKAYDTATAEEVCDISATHGLSESDPAYDRTSLYRTETGRYFAAGTSGALGRWRRPAGGGQTGGSGIEALSEGEALLLAERYCSRERCEELFGPFDEA
jgi:hypothetical protein